MNSGGILCCHKMVTFCLINSTRCVKLPNTSFCFYSEFLIKKIQRILKRAFLLFKILFQGMKYLISERNQGIEKSLKRRLKKTTRHTEKWTHFSFDTSLPKRISKKNHLISKQWCQQSIWTIPYQCHVTMSLTRGQYAWFFTQQGRTQNVKSIQRDIFLQKSSTMSVKNHQRLNVEKHSSDWSHHWLVGLTDGHGTFSIDRQIKANGQTIWNLVYKISLSQYNTRALLKAQEILGAGNIIRTADNMLTLRVRDRGILEQRVFPLFDRLSLLSNKHYDYVRVRRVAHLLHESLISEEITKTLQHQIETIYSVQSSQDMIAPIWSQILSWQSLQDFNETGLISLEKTQVQQVLSLPWILGFLEAKGSFSIKRKDHCHAFGLTQVGNGLLMQALRKFLKIGASVKLRKSFQGKSFYSLETTNWRTLQYIRKMFTRKFLGIKSLEFRIWERSMKHRHNSKKLQETRALLKKLRKYHQL